MSKKKRKNFEELNEQPETTGSVEQNKDSEGVNKCCKEQIELMGDKYLRLLAEFENFKKRTLKEKEELYKTASSKVITAILPILDDLDRALMAVSVNEENQAFINGISLISKKFQAILNQMGLEPINTFEQEFNTDFHEALTTLDVEESKKGKVIEEIEKGYLLNGHLIRYAKVIVGK